MSYRRFNFSKAARIGACAAGVGLGTHIAMPQLLSTDNRTHIRGFAVQAKTKEVWNPENTHRELAATRSRLHGTKTFPVFTADEVCSWLTIWGG